MVRWHWLVTLITFVWALGVSIQFAVAQNPQPGDSTPIYIGVKSYDLYRNLVVGDFTIEAGKKNRQVLQNALNNMRGGTGVTLPSGPIAIAGEPTEVGGMRALLHVPQSIRGGIIQGQGESCVSCVNAKDQRFSGAFSALVYVGPEPMEPTALLAIPSCRDIVIQNLSFHGRPFLRDPPYANTTALAVVRDRDGIGSGLHKFHNLTFDKWDVAMQFGVHKKDSNNDECYIERPTFVNCRIGVQLNAHMAMGHTFVCPIYEHGVDIAFQINHGGTLKVWGGFIGVPMDAFLQIFDSGANNGRYEVRSLHHHGISTDRKTKFVDMPGSGHRDCTITFENLDCKAGYQPGDIMFDLYGPSNLYLDKCYGLQPGTIKLRSSGSGNRYQPFVAVDQSVLGGPNINSVGDLMHPDSTGKWHWKGTANRRFYSQDNTPIPDEQSYPQGAKSRD